MIGWHPRFAGAFESPWSIAQKLAWLNACEVPQILSILVGRNIPPSPPSGLRHFNDTGWWEDRLDLRADDPGAKELFEAAHAVLGNHDGQRFRALAAPLLASDIRLCTPCIRTGYHSIMHQLAGLTRCPIHGTPLHETCPQCRHPLGPCAVAFHRGFRCMHCDVPFLTDDELLAPSEHALAVQSRIMGSVAAWIERALPQVHVPWRRAVMFGRWEKGTMQAVSFAAALIPFLATIEPCPLASRYLVPPVPQLKARLASSQAAPEPMDASVSHTQVSEVIAVTRAWLCDTVVGEHDYCYRHGAAHLWCDRDYLAFRPEFCRRGYAFTLWHSRTHALLSEIQNLACFPNRRIIIDPVELKERLISSYHATLNNIELLFAMYEQEKTFLLEAVMRCGCLERGWDAWTQLEEDISEQTWRLAPCTVAFMSRPETTELFCDHGAMVLATWTKRFGAVEAMRTRSALDPGASPSRSKR